MVELMAVADCLPPAAMKLLGGPAPVSSMTWQLNLLADAPVTQDGWWLAASGGGPCARRQFQPADGDLVRRRHGDRDQMQSVAVFA